MTRPDGQLTHFFPSVPFLYALKTSGNCKIFRCFEGVEKGGFGNKLVNRGVKENSKEINS